MRINLLLLLIFISTAAVSQTTITGKVLDARDSTALIGVSVSVKNNRTAVQTDQSGNFTIKAEPGNELVFSHVGYAQVELPASQNMAVYLSSAEKNLSEVVVVGYGTRVRKDVTGSISKITSKDVENLPLPSFEEALQGKAAGVVIQSGSGRVGQGINIKIRGTSSITANSQPLYVVDGLPVISNSLSDATNDPTNPLIDINPNDIESIEILKDASAAAIYGARAANGVVLITTKKGRNNQKTTFTLNVSRGYSNPARKKTFANAKQYVDLIELAATSDGTYDFTNGINYFRDYDNVDTAIADYRDWYETNVLDYLSLGTDWRNNAVNTDWQNLLYHKNAQTNQIDLSASGGDAKTRFFVSGFYNTQDAIVINNKFYRYGGRMNLEHKATDRLTLGINVAVDRSQLNKVANDNAFSTPGQMVAQVPISPLIDPETGQLNKNTLYPNSLFDAQYSFDKQVTVRTIGNGFLNYAFTNWLSFRSEFGADLFNLTEEEFLGKETIDGSSVGGQGSFITSQSTSFNTNNYFTFSPRLNDNSKLDAVLGMSYLQNDTKGAVANGEAFPSDAIKNVCGATKIPSATSTNDRYNFLSYFLRGNYAFKDRYLISASIRTDASSRFGTNNRYGWFPAGSVGWVISDEKFMRDISAISLLKVRASYGLTGNAEIGQGNFLSLYSVSNYPELPGFIPSQLGNKDLKWEKTAQTDLGLDLGFLNNRITATFDWYKKHTTDLLLSVNIPSTTGYTTILRNLGTMNNQGVELTINSNNLTGKFKWNTSLNVAYNKNKIINIKGQIIKAGFSLEQRAIEGEPIGVFYGQKFLGVDPETGDALFLGEDGKPTADFENAARVVLGKSNPDWTGGFTNTFSYAGFDLNVFFVFVSGNKVNNAAGTYQSDGFYNGFDNQTIDLLNAWRKPGDITNVPRIGYFYGTGYQETSSRWLYDGSYIRLRTLTLGYTIPKSALQRLGIQSARIYATGLNLWTKTKYPGDPEVNTLTVTNITGGQDFYTIPQAKTITVGLNINF
ncbi:MAG: SusC/RagA family TonB-linked outer membrane protein [Ilyomonas sp.]